MYIFFFNKILFINLFFNALKKILIRYPSPQNIGYLWNHGSLAGFFLTVQIATGLFLTMFYSDHIDLAFYSVDHIMKDISYGWLIRYLHANGASFFFFFVYIHIFRGIFYNSYQYPRTYIWITGCVIYFLLMGSAFLGYVLPWGQMSFWAATVITNFITVVPFFGGDLLQWVWGGYSVSNATLNRFFCLHYLLPFLLFILMILHLILLHQSSSSNELKLRSYYENRILFYPYFIIKDIFGGVIALILFSYVVFFLPEIFNDSVNYEKANPLVTPSHIVPEWYFLPYYAVLRSVLNKTVGIIAFIISVGVFFFFSNLHPNLGKNLSYTESYMFFFWFFFFNFCFLGFLGSQTAEVPCIELGLFCSIMHFYFTLVVLPIITNSLENSYLFSNKIVNSLYLKTFSYYYNNLSILKSFSSKYYPNN